MILPIFLEVVHQFPAYQFVLAGLPHIDSEIYHQIIGDANVRLVKNETYSLLSKSQAALVASGTATLECALFKVPMLVGYKANFLSYHIGKHLIKVPYIALVNLIAGRKIVPELIQDDLNAETLEKELKIILSEEASNEMKSNFETLIANLGTTGASDRAAEIIIKS